MQCDRSNALWLCDVTMPCAFGYLIMNFKQYNVRLTKIG